MKIVEDSVYGPIRSEICDAYIAAGKPQPEKNWLYSRLVETRFNYKQFQGDVSKAFAEVYALGADMSGDFKAGVHMAIEELCERLGFGLEIEDCGRGGEIEKP